MDRISFLQAFISTLQKDFADTLHKTTIVFPNRRAGLFFKDKLAKSTAQAKLMPQVLTFEDMAVRMSKLVLADKLILVYQLYEVFRQHDHHIESFDRFYFWGEMLLADFSEVDMALVNARDLFTNLKDLKSIEAGYDYLSEEQKKIIARFWESFRYDQEENVVSSSQDRFLIFWNKLFPVYQQFRNELLEQGLAYEGLLYRHIAESLTEEEARGSQEQFVFVGMNALKNAELQILNRLISSGKATVYWDTDVYYLNHEVQEAGMFQRKYARSKILGPTFPSSIADHYHSGSRRHIHMHGVPLEVGQAKKVGEYLLELSQKEGFDPERCVIVLPEEHMLFPVLHALPPAIRKVNVTMGYPLRSTSLYSFIEHILNLQLEKRQQGTQAYVYHFETLLALLRHPYIKNYLPAEADENIQDIKKSNAIYVNPAGLKGKPSFYQKVLAPVEDVPSLFDYLQQLSMLLHQMLHTQNETEQEEIHETIPGSSDIDNSARSEKEAPVSLQNMSVPDVPMLEQELLYHFYIHLNRLKSLTQERHFDFELPAFIKLLRQVFQSLRVPFTGEPLRGLQIMGLLETRNLDFDHVFVLSMNEGIMPASESQTSFIPANLRKGFGIFGVDQQDAFYAHAFFRLLHHAQEVHLFYNTEDTSTLNGEMSRFLYQLYYESERTQNDELRFPDAAGDFVVSRDFLSMKIAPTSPIKISMAKTEEVWKHLLVYRKGSSYPRQSMLTPSALNTYLDCRLKFYYQYVVCMREMEEVEDELDAKVFGNILHKTMEVLYKDFVQLKGSRTIEAQDCLQLKSGKLDEAIHKGFKEHYRQEKEQEFNFEGRNIIAREIVRKMGRQILDHDSRYAPFEIVSLEERGKQGYYADLEIDVDGEKFCIAFKGIIDRVDRKDNVVRVLDYKTGRDERKTPDIDSLFDREHPRRNKAAMQALFYAWLYQETQNKQEEKVISGLVNAAELFKEDFDPRLKIGEETMEDFADYREIFLSGLINLVQEIFNRKIPFDQTTDDKKCNFCPYANICY
ncbi:PD-(D/E)XK nuclease family protein [Catalinimonas niigatensis]|uniref:PD-(D/E)XK nuclease family protein n=1 Tax=Catalinimonas niigatensis TaxID=1397264 RepID=UPI0026664DF1|nr:PD-(D/E)XK nuclease family protein [Catalinimonas niigatensis]WPP49604.1 PD-(D/E)XK nuclease family protein [Catalinimonas niigatensis]